MTTPTTPDRQDAERVTQETWMAGVKALAALIDSHLIASKPRNQWLAPKPLKHDEVMLIWMANQGNGVVEFARAIERAHGIGEAK